MKMFIWGLVIFLLFGVVALLFVGGSILGGKGAQPWRTGPGITLEFQCADPKIDVAMVRKIMAIRLEDQHADVGDLGAGKLSVWIPYPEARQRAREEMTVAWQAFTRDRVTAESVAPTLQLDEPKREEAFKQLAPAGGPRLDKLHDLATAFDAQRTAAAAAAAVSGGAIPPDVMAKLAKAKNAYLAASLDLNQLDLRPSTFWALLVPADNPSDVRAQIERDRLPRDYPSQAPLITRVIDARAAWRATGGGSDIEPEDVERIVTTRGEVTFRIAVLPVKTEITAEQLDNAKNLLLLKGPATPVDLGTVKARWFEILPNGAANLVSGGYATTTTPDGNFILCYDEHDRMITHDDPKRDSWAVSARVPYSDSVSGAVQLPFFLDPKGALYMGDMTDRWKDHPMAILLDDKVMSAPNIHSKIGDAGVITFGTATPAHPLNVISKEAYDLKHLMDSPSLPFAIRRIR